MAAPKPLGSKTLDEQVVRKDRKQAERFDQWGLGSKAIYVNSKWRPRAYYIPYESVTHVFRRVAVSPGSGKAFLTPILYMVILYDGGKEFSMDFKYADAAERMMQRLEREHPSICLLSPAGEQQQKERQEREERIRNRVLPADEQHEVTRLEDARWTLEKRPALTRSLAGVARMKRTVDNIKPVYQYIAITAVALGFLLIVAGMILRYLGGNGTAAALMALMGAALMFVMGNSRILPTRKRNRKSLQQDYDKALADMERYLRSERDFPVPARYAHPDVCTRMIRIIKEERAKTCEQALDVLKEDLRQMDSSVALTGDDYTQVITIKPLFLVADYM